MRHGFLLASGLTALLALGGVSARAQTPAAPSSPGVTTGALAALCSQGGGTDMVAAAATGYCRGFLIGVGQFHREITTVRHIRPALFCLPTPSPTIEQAQASFVGWVNAHPDEAGYPATIGLLRWAAATYPCAEPAARPARARR